MMGVLLISAVLEVQRTKATFGEVQVCVVLYLAVFFFSGKRARHSPADFSCLIGLLPMFACVSFVA